MEIKQAISLYLTAKAYNDPNFKAKFENKNKNLDECVLYIQAKMFEKVKNQKDNDAACVVPSDDEVFGLAEQYYIDEDLKVDGNTFNNVKVVSLSATSFTDEEKEQMRKDAIREYQDKVIEEQRKKDEERKAKAKAAKEKKPAAPILVPDTTTNEPIEPKHEEVKQAQQLSLF